MHSIQQNAKKLVARSVENDVLGILRNPTYSAKDNELYVAKFLMEKAESRIVC
jgi:hypothetical protein